MAISPGQRRRSCPRCNRDNNSTPEWVWWMIQWCDMPHTVLKIQHIPFGSAKLVFKFTQGSSYVADLGYWPSLPFGSETFKVLHMHVDEGLLRYLYNFFRRALNALLNPIRFFCDRYRLQIPLNGHWSQSHGDRGSQ
jgi:hypothetical protein